MRNLTLPTGSGGVLNRFPTQAQTKKGSVMSKYEFFSTCYACRSIDLEIVHNDDFGPMTACTQCGYSWVSTFEDFTADITITKASQPPEFTACLPDIHSVNINEKFPHVILNS